MNRFLLFFAILIVISFHACDGGGVNDNDAVVCDSAAILADHIETHEDVITDTDTINPLACPGDQDLFLVPGATQNDINVYEPFLLTMRIKIT